MSVPGLRKRIKSSLRFRLTLLITLLTAILTAVFTSFYVVHERSSFTSQLLNEGDLLASILSASIQIPLYAGNNEEVALHTSEIFTHRVVCCARIFNSRGEQIVYAARHGANTPCSGLNVTRMIIADSDTYSPESLLLGEGRASRVTGRIELELDTSQLKTLTRNMVLISSLLALLLWLTATGITFIILKRVTATFQLLMSGVKRIEQGDLSSRIPVDEDDEPGRALSAINSLAEALERKSADNERLQAEVVQGLRLQIDEEKNKHMAKLIQTNRMTSLGLLVSSMAHEINNPNGAIRLAAEILERAWKDVQPVLNEVADSEGEFSVCGMPYREAFEDIEKAVDAISRSSTRIEQVIFNLRSYSLGDRDRQQIMFDLNRVAENAVAIVRAHGRMASITITTALSINLPPAAGNPFQLEQVVINLLLNAIQAMSLNNGQVITLASMVDKETDEVLLVLKDSGPGIKAENLPYIFEPFFSTRIDQGGSGLGLYIASFILKEQNGTLEITNDESGGCRAVVRLPAAKSDKSNPSKSPLSSTHGA